MRKGGRKGGQGVKKGRRGGRIGEGQKEMYEREDRKNGK